MTSLKPYKCFLLVTHVCFLKSVHLKDETMTHGSQGSWLRSYTGPYPCKKWVMFTWSSIVLLLPLEKLSCFYMSALIFTAYAFMYHCYYVLHILRDVQRLIPYQMFGIVGLVKLIFKHLGSGKNIDIYLSNLHLWTHVIEWVMQMSSTYQWCLVIVATKILRMSPWRQFFSNVCVRERESILLEIESEDGVISHKKKITLLHKWFYIRCCVTYFSFYCK